MKHLQTPILTRDDIQRSRSQASLGNWVNEIAGQFQASDVAKSEYRLNKVPFVKEFSEEVLPLNLYAEAYYKDDDDVRFRPVIGNQSYHAVVETVDGMPLHYVQVTQACDGYQAHLQMLHLEEYGHAPLTGPNLRKKEHGGIVESKLEFQRKDLRIAAELEIIRAQSHREEGGDAL